MTLPPRGKNLPQAIFWPQKMLWAKGMETVVSKLWFEIPG